MLDMVCSVLCFYSEILCYILVDVLDSLFPVHLILYLCHSTVLTFPLSYFFGVPFCSFSSLHYSIMFSSLLSF